MPAGSSLDGRWTEGARRLGPYSPEKEALVLGGR